MINVFVRSHLTYRNDLAILKKELVSFWQNNGGIPEKQVVLMKPNLLSPHTPEEAITTHPWLVDLACQILKDYGNRLLIADSPAGSHFKSIRKIWQLSGMQEVAEKYGATLVDLSGRGLQERKGIRRNYFFTDLLQEADYLLNLPKLKTHGLTVMTGAMKNLFGLIPGIQKGEFHVRYPQPEEFAETLVDVFSAVQPRFTIMDAVEILEGNGPSSGGKKRYAGFLLASENAVAVDVVAASLLGIQPGEVPMIRAAQNWRLGPPRHQDIGIDGANLQPLNAQLPSPHIFNRIPRPVHQVLKRLIWTRPKADKNNCTGCGICIKNCPAEAMFPNADRLPVIDYQKCINCFCCAEVCPDSAIVQESSWLVRKLS